MADWISNGLSGKAFAAAAAALALGLAAAPAASSAPSFGFGYDGAWATTWAASPEPPRSPPTVLNNQTIREFAHISIGAGRFRIRLTNEYGANPVTIGAVHFAQAGPNSSILATDRAVTFGGRPTVTIPAFGVVLSDPIDVSVFQLSTVAVSLFFPGSSGEATGHFFGLQNAYVGAGQSGRGA